MVHDKPHCKCLINRMELEGTAQATLGGALSLAFISRGYQSVNKGGGVKGWRRLGLDPALRLPARGHPEGLLPPQPCPPLPFPGLPVPPVALWYQLMYSGTVGAGATPTPEHPGKLYGPINCQRRSRRAPEEDQGTWAGPSIQALAGLKGWWDWIQVCVQWGMDGGLGEKVICQD